MRKFSSLLLLILLGQNVYGQSCKGEIRSEEDKTKIIPFAKLNFVDIGVIISSDSLGQWELKDINPGAVRVEISAYGFQTTLEVIEVSDFPIIIYLADNHRELDKFIITHTGVLQNQSISAIETMNINDINRIPSISIGESLGNIPGVYQTGIGIGVSKPVIRGLSGSSVVTYLNSLRIENQQWGGDHGLPITGIGISNVEVIKGPASLLYGADAMGGVLYFVDEPYAAINSFQVEAQSRFDAVTMGTTNQLGLKFSKQKLRINAYGSYDNHADFQLPNGNFVMNSRFNQSAAKVSVGYTKKKWVINLRYNFYHGRIGLPGHTHEANPVPSDFETTVQNRTENLPAQHITNHFIALEQKLFLRRHEFHFTLGHTRNGLQEYEEKYFTPDIYVQLNNSLYNAKWRFKLSEKMDLFVGSQGMLQINSNQPIAPEQLIPDAQTLDLGAFALYTFHHKLWHFQAGGRIDKRSIVAELIDPNLNFSRNFNGFNYSVGFARLAKLSSFRMNLSTGFRAPTSSELLSDGIHHGTFRIERGNANLATEKATQLDLSYAFHFHDLELIINPFYNRIRDYIYLESSGEIEDDYPVYEYQQAQFAQLYGIDFGFHYHPHNAHWLHLESTFSNVFAEDEFKNPLPLIPQTRINNQVRIDFKSQGKFNIKNLIVQHNYFFKQNRISQYETASKNYNLVNIGLNFEIKFKVPLTVGLGVRNVLNETYIDHLSGLKLIGLSNPGRSVYGSVKIELNQKLKNREK